MKHYVYKIIDANGNFYIGRHSTENLNDNYMGSGTWVNSVNKDSLTKEILEFANNFNELKQLEEKYIAENFNLSKCKNIKLASVGWTSEDARRVALQQIKDGKNALTGERGSALAKETNRKRINEGTHPFLKNGKARAVLDEMIEKGTHPFCDGSQTKERIKQQISNGSHPGTKVFATHHICPHCGKDGKGAVMYKHHYQNCKSLKIN